jgi:ankyrin repeat protein
VTILRGQTTAISESDIDRERYALEKAINKVELEEVTKQLQTGQSKAALATALYEAASKGYLEAVQALLSANADPNAGQNGRTALLAASQNGYVEVVRALLAAKASPNVSSAIKTSKAGAFVRANASGWTPLMAASSKGHVQVVRALLAAKAQVNATHIYSYSVGLSGPLGWDTDPQTAYETIHTTALHEAGANGHLEVIRVLLAAGANAKEVGGNTALREAAKRGERELVQALLAAGAYADAKALYEASATAMLRWCGCSSPPVLM